MVEVGAAIVRAFMGPIQREFVLHRMYLRKGSFCFDSVMQGRTAAVTSGQWEVIDILKVTEDSV